MKKSKFIRLNHLKTMDWQNGNFEELTKKISSVKLDWNWMMKKPKLGDGIVEMEQKLEEQKKHITELFNAQGNYDSKFLQ